MQKRQSARALQQHIKKLLEHLTTTELRTVLSLVCERPVYTLSLSWRDGDTPSHQHMVETATDAVKAPGLSEHQVLMVAHNDAPCRHIHIIANLVHPETGKTRNMWHDQYKLSKWAEAYENKFEMQCLQRVENNARRARGEFVKYDDLTRAEWAIIKKYQRMSPEEIRTQRAAQQLSEREDMTTRHHQQQSLLASELIKFYGPGRRALETTLTELQKRLGPQGDMRGRAKLWIRRLTGAQRRDQNLSAAVTRSIANVDSRMNERRQTTLDGIKLEAQLLAARHNAQRRRDEALIATARNRAEEETERRRAREKFHKHYKVRANKDTAQHTPDESDKNLLRNAYRTTTTGQAKPPANDRGQDNMPDQEQAPEKRRPRRGERGQNRTPDRHRHRPRRRQR